MSVSEGVALEVKSDGWVSEVRFCGVAGARDGNWKNVYGVCMCAVP